MKTRSTSRLVYSDDAEGATGRQDVEVARIRAADRPKTSTASKTTLSICLMRAKVVASSPICKSSVVDLVDLVMSRDHQNDNAVWHCRVTKKACEATEGLEQSAFEPPTTRTKVSGLPKGAVKKNLHQQPQKKKWLFGAIFFLRPLSTTSAISESTNTRRKKSIESRR